MDVINQIIQQSAIGAFSNAVRKIVLTVFLAIVLTLLSMLTALLLNGQQIHISFGY
ncbi:hypothetical protein [Robiginitalea sp. IMCC43444]|jgi:hypothetical protein|uniref:hypothetical protein n=1 Tax=Robiginitalea sp. IMCC43444 TaxID=3459121 RepID=UPI0040418FC2